MSISNSLHADHDSLEQFSGACKSYAESTSDTDEALLLFGAYYALNELRKVTYRMEPSAYVEKIRKAAGTYMPSLAGPDFSAKFAEAQERGAL